MEVKALKDKVNELMVNQHHMLEAIKYLSDKVEEMTKNANCGKSDVKDILKSQTMMDEIIVKNSDDIESIKKSKEENAAAIKVLDTKIDKVREEIEMTKNCIEDKIEKAKSELKPQKTSTSIECNLCEESFNLFSNLENHIKKAHEDYQQFKCDQCEKTFVLKWRLRKHMNLHNKSISHPCHYFNNGKKCPFEDLGCKFFHTVSEICKYGPTCTKRMCPFRHLQETSDNVTEMDDSQISENDDNEKLSNEVNFITSTPLKRKFDCEECHDQSQCTDCFVRQHTQNKQESFSHQDDIGHVMSLPMSGRSRSSIVGYFTSN